MAFDTTIKMVDAPAELNLKLQPLNRKTIRITTSDNSDTDFYVLTYTFIHKDSTDYPFFKFNERGTILNDSTYHIRNITGQLRRIKNGKTFAIPYSSDLDTDNWAVIGQSLAYTLSVSVNEVLKIFVPNQKANATINNSQAFKEG